jgi:hypothetical protein
MERDLDYFRRSRTPAPAVGHPRSRIFQGLHIEVELKFVLQVLFDLPAKNRRTQSQNNVFPRHFRPSSILWQ